MIRVDHDVLAINLWQEMAEGFEGTQEFFFKYRVFLLCVRQMSTVEPQRLIGALWGQHLERAAHREVGRVREERQGERSVGVMELNSIF